MVLYIRRRYKKDDYLERICGSIKSKGYIDNRSKESCSRDYQQAMFSKELYDWCELLQQELDSMPSGVLMFNAPDIMILGITERIEVRISQKLDCCLLNNLKGRGFPQTEILKISSLMKVKLTGDSFTIIELNEEEQIISKKEYSEWAWDVMPKKSGIRKLYLHVTLRMILPHGEERKDHPVLEREINVNVNLKFSSKKIIKKYWKWIISSLSLPLIIWIIQKVLEKYFF